MMKIITYLFVTGLLFGSGPCLASCGLILLSYIAGTKKNIFKGLVVYSLFSLARISVYLLLGLLIFFLGKFTLEKLLGDLSFWIFILGGGFIILVGALTAWGKQFMLKQDKKNVIILGLIIGLLPCVPLLAILTYVGLISKSWLQSLLYSLSFGLGTFVSPLILLSILAGMIPLWLQDKKFYYIFRFICGLIIVSLGIQLLIRGLKR